MDELIDRSRSIRQGEELDVERLSAYLRAKLSEVPADEPIRVEQFPSGHSNLTYLLKSGDKEYVLRRPPFGSKVKSAHDMGREHRILSKLHAVYPLAPEPVLFCEDPDVMGVDFYVMRRIKGIILRRDLPRGLVMTPEQTRSLHEALVDNLVNLHSIDYAAAGLADLGKPAGYVERQVSGWSERYQGSKTDDIPVVDQVAAWLKNHKPADSGSALIHNDYKLDNVVLDPNDPTRIIGVLDWEMSTLGDPLMDLGTTVSYWINGDDSDQLQAMRMAPTTVPGSMTRRQLTDRYAEKSGRDVTNILFYYVFGLFKTAVVVQQIYYRYKQGLTTDERFAAFIMGVQILCNQAAESIESGRI